MKTIRYDFMAVVVSLCWWPVLQIAPSMREILGGDVLEISVPEELLLFCITGLLVARAFRTWIARATGFANLVLGAVIPLVAAEVFAALLLIYGVLRGKSDFEFGLIWAPVATVAAFWVVIPAGVAAQYLMRWAASRPMDPQTAGEQLGA